MRCLYRYMTHKNPSVKRKLWNDHKNDIYCSHITPLPALPSLSLLNFQHRPQYTNRQCYLPIVCGSESHFLTWQPLTPCGCLDLCWLKQTKLKTQVFSSTSHISSIPQLAVATGHWYTQWTEGHAYHGRSGTREYTVHTQCSERRRSWLSSLSWAQNHACHVETHLWSLGNTWMMEWWNFGIPNKTQRWRHSIGIDAWE